MRTAIIVLLAAFGIQLSAHAQCGSRGGPGYRDQADNCVGWASIGRICCYPPTLRCKPEQIRPGADEAAKAGVEVDRLKRKAHGELASTCP
jgi:hypothetical protein